MAPDWLPSFSLRSSENEQEDNTEGLPARVQRSLRNHAWAAGLAIVVVWLLFTPIFFAVLGLVLDNFVLAFVLAPLLALAAAGGLASSRGWLEPLGEARRAAPLWVRLIVPVPVFVLVLTLSFFGLGSVVTGFTILGFASLLIALSLTGAFVWGLGLWHDVPGRVLGAPLWARLLFPIPLLVVFTLFSFSLFGGWIQDFRLLMLASLATGTLATGALVALTGLWANALVRAEESTPVERLVVLVLTGAVAGLVVFLAALMVLEQVNLALATVLPAFVGGVALAGWISSWWRDAHQAVAGWHVGARAGAFLVVLLGLTLYFALLLGPFLPTALAGYGVALVLALALAVPLSSWVGTWRDAWGGFVSMGEDRRLLATLPILPVSIVVLFVALAVPTDSFALAYVLSVPLGVALFLLAGVPFGVTRDIPGLVRKRRLPVRFAIFAGVFLLAAVYAYYGVALFVDIVEVAIVAGVVFGAVLLGVLITWLNLHVGLQEEFESYGGVAEAFVLGVVFVAALAVSFLLVALSLGDFRVAFLVSVVVASGVAYVLAHTTELVDGLRETVAGLPWWAEMGVVSFVFVLALVYGTVAVGVFRVPLEVALVLGALFALGSVVAFSRDLALGRGVVASADEDAGARVPLLVLAFLGGFLVGLYVSAMALGAVGLALFGIPFFVALVVGVVSVLALARLRGWDAAVVSRVRTRSDKAKTVGIVVAWLVVGVVLGFVLQMVPVEGPVLGVGGALGFPLALTLAVGLLVSAWLPVVLFRAVRVSQSPVGATASLQEKHRSLAGVGWGLVVFCGVLVLALTFQDNTVLAVGVALVLGYVVALALSARRGADPEEG